MPHVLLPSPGRCIRIVAATVLAALLAACGGSGDSGNRATGAASATVGTAAPGAFGQAAPPAAICGTADLSGAGSFVYVSTTGADVRGCGSTTNKACKTIQYGIDSCAATGCAVLVRHGLYPTTATIALKNGVSVYGSCRFDGEPDRKYRTTIQASPAPGTPAVSADGIDTATAFAGIVVLAKDETANGTASIGVAVNNSKGLSLSQSTLVAGRGGDGSAGGKVAPTPGNKGSDAVLTLGQSTWEGSGGAGAPACVYAQQSAGAGGVGAAKNSIDSFNCFILCGCKNTGGTIGARGGPGGGGILGGGGGSMGPNGPVCSPGGTPSEGGTGGTGAPGACSQTPGVADSSPWGTFSASAWKPGAGGGGNLGEWGAGGGGGGAGTSCTNELTDYFGYPGGGGGGGGCGGPGGTGGQQGGASLALVLTHSSMAVDSGGLTIVPGSGGNGGQGGPGSSGGAGGKGGRDGKAVYYPGQGACVASVNGGNEGGFGYGGGAGGVGGDGGGGSGAAGGNGGPSVGIGLSGNSVAPSALAGIYLGLPGIGGAQGPGGAGADCTGTAGTVGAGGGSGPVVNLDKPAPSVLTTGQDLIRGQSRTSANGAYALLLQTDGNLCLKTLPGLNYIWCSAENNLGYADRVAMQTDGNLCLSTGGNTTGCAGTAPHPRAYLSVRDDGRAVIYDGSTALWTVP